MNYLTRYYSNLKEILALINKKLMKLKSNFLSLSFFLFIGFLTGNLFGIIVSYIRQQGISDNLIIILLLFLNEFINFNIYNTQKNEISKIFQEKLLNVINSFKVGILLGFFIDAFKVGS